MVYWHAHALYNKFRSHVGGVQASSYIQQPMTPGYFEISNVLCQVLSDTSLLFVKSMSVRYLQHVPAVPVTTHIGPFQCL